MPKDLVVSSIALALFIVCPRMAGMVHVISKYSHVSLFYTAFIGCLVSIPLVLCMVFIFGRFGLWGALAFCVLTDLGSAFIVKEISIRAGVETFVIALFVIAGVKVAPLVTNIFLKGFKIPS